jgi:hypothetical protein
MNILSATLTGTLLFFLTSCSGGIQIARFYKPININEKTTSVDWGDGTATAQNDICVWVKDSTALYIPIMVGPIGLPIIPTMADTGERDNLNFFQLSLWIVPDENKKTILFNPSNIFIEFEDGTVMQPQRIQITRFKATRLEYNYFGERRVHENVLVAEHSPPKRLSDFNEPIDLLRRARLIIRFTKPNKNVAPKSLEIKKLGFKNDPAVNFSFSFDKVEERRYVYSGKNADGEWIGTTPEDSCLNLLKNK